MRARAGLRVDDHLAAHLHRPLAHVDQPVVARACGALGSKPMPSSFTDRCTCSGPKCSFTSTCFGLGVLGRVREALLQHAEQRQLHVSGASFEQGARSARTSPPPGCARGRSSRSPPGPAPRSKSSRIMRRVRRSSSMDSSADAFSSAISCCSASSWVSASRYSALDDQRREAGAQAVVDLAGEAVALLHHRQLLQVALQLDHLAVRRDLALVQVHQHVDDDEVERQVPEQGEHLDRGGRAVEQLVEPGDDQAARAAAGGSPAAWGRAARRGW